jgi:hypothetical protein
MRQANPNSHLKSNSGMVTTDFIFSFFLVSLFTAFLFAMCFSFTVIEVVQYISFSATRAALPSNKNFERQRERAERKASALINDPILTTLLKNGWFNVTIKDMRLGKDASDYYSSEYKMEPIGGASPVPFYVPAAGVRLNLEAKILQMNLGPLGKIESETGNGFSLTLGSLMFREPSQKECSDMIRARYQKILNLDSKYSSIASKGAASAVPMEDTGC